MKVGNDFRGCKGKQTGNQYEGLPHGPRTPLKTCIGLKPSGYVQRKTWMGSYSGREFMFPRVELFW